VKRDFNQNDWGQAHEDDLKRLIAIAISEDFGGLGDLTSQALIPSGIQGRASFYARKEGVIAGLVAVPTCISLIDPALKWFSCCQEGQFVEKGAKLGEFTGPVLSMMTAERLLLNLLSHLCGIATLTQRFVKKVEGTGAKIYDTRKTTLGWRRLDKYAVRCGGGMNHRTGLFDAVLIKDNHLAFGALPGYVLDSERSENVTTGLAKTKKYCSCPEHRGDLFSPGEAVCRAKAYLHHLIEEKKAEGITDVFPGNQIPLVEIEIDTLDHFEGVLAVKPDIVLLDNMRPELMRNAVQIRNRLHSATELEASGGITLDIVREVAETGVERISVGSLTHSNFSLDIGMDWEG